MTRIFSLLLLAVLLGAPVAASAGDPFGPPFASSMSDDIFRGTAYNAGQKSPGVAFTTNDPARLTIFGRLPFGVDYRHAKLDFGDGWSGTWTNDQLGKSLAVTHPIHNFEGLKDGRMLIGVVQEKALTPASQGLKPGAGIYFHYTWQ